MLPTVRAMLVMPLVFLCLPSVAWAGMPDIRLSDMAKMRFQTISFFLALFVVSSGLVMFLWNRLRRDFRFLPRLGFGPAVGLVTVWGLLFLLVLTMISGARELMTPGAWKKDGLTYKLASPPTPQPAPSSMMTDDYNLARLNKLSALRMALWKYARAHDGQFPPSATGTEIEPETWVLPGVSGARYLYKSGLTADVGDKPLAFEPEIFEGLRWVLLTNGEIKQMNVSEIAARDFAEKPQ